MEKKRFILEHIKLQFEEIKSGATFCEAQKICRYCKKKTDANAKICPHCGRDIEIKRRLKFKRSEKQKTQLKKKKLPHQDQQEEEMVVIELEIDSEDIGNSLFVQGLNKLFIPADILRTSRLNSILHLIDDYYNTNFQKELFGNNPQLGEINFPEPNREQISQIEDKMRSFAKVWSTKHCSPEMAEKILELALSDLL